MPERLEAPAMASLGALRVVEAVWARHGDGPIGGLYTELGQRFHGQNDKSLSAVSAALQACGLDRALFAAAEDDGWDHAIRSSMAEALELAGPDVGVPVLAFRHDEDRVYAISGPVMAPTATGDEALDLWDHVVGLARIPTFFELKRSRSTRR